MNADLKREKALYFQYTGSRSAGCTARAVGYAIFTQSESLQELESNIRDATLCHFGSARPFRLQKS